MKKMLLGAAVALLSLTGCNNDNQQATWVCAMLMHCETCSAYQSVKPSWPLSPSATGHKTPNNHSTGHWTTS